MRFATIRLPGNTAAVRLEGDVVRETGYRDVGDLLQSGNWRSAPWTNRPVHRAEDVDYAPLIALPSKVICVGLNYADHIAEMARPTPDYPTLFTKFASSLIGATDTIDLPVESSAMDWEAELALIVSSPGRRIRPEDATNHIAGYTILNDVTARDWQSRTSEWLQGKSFERTSPLGPVLVTPDELDVRDDGTPALAISTTLNGEIVQESETSRLVFGPAALVSYISTFVTLVPGDVIATGTPAGVGHGRVPPRHLEDGDVLVTQIAGLGRCRNVCRRMEHNQETEAHE